MRKQWMCRPCLASKHMQRLQLLCATLARKDMFILVGAWAQSAAACRCHCGLGRFACLWCRRTSRSSSKPTFLELCSTISYAGAVASFVFMPFGVSAPVIATVALLCARLVMSAAAL